LEDACVRCITPKSLAFLGPARVRVPPIGYDPFREGAMRLAEGKDMVLSLILTGQRDAASSFLVNPVSPEGDPGKFLLDGKAARAIHRFSGWHVPISLGWFAGGYDQPVINGTAFYWYAFAIPERGMYQADHYFICDYLQMREWVLSFTAPLGNAHRDHASWRADLRLYPGERAGYFRWGDEPVGVNEQPGRVFEVDNLVTITMPAPPGQHVGGYGPGGESAAHKLLKLYVAGHPLEFGLTKRSRFAEDLADLGLALGDVGSFTDLDRFEWEAVAA
jgi:hypothetical protein